MRLNQITIPCTDYDISVAFYTKIGLRQIVANPPRYARFETQGGTTLSLHKVETVPEESQVVVYFEVVDVDETMRSLRNLGIEPELDPVDQTWLWREAYLRDPAGNRICVYKAGRNRRYPPWRIGDDTD